MRDESGAFFIDRNSKEYATTRTTLFSKGANFLTKLVENDDSCRLNSMRDESGAFFIDRNSDAFAVVLDYLRTGILSFEHPTVSRQQLYVELDFYQIAREGLQSHASQEFLARSAWLCRWREEAKSWTEEMRGFLMGFMVLQSESKHKTVGAIDICDRIMDNKQSWFLSYRMQRFPEEQFPDEHHEFVRHLSKEEDILSDPLPALAVYTVTSPDGDKVQYNYIWWQMATGFLALQFDSKVVAQLQDDGGSVYKRLYLNWTSLVEV
eukprot:CAMPEP_0114618334 /NCGR_PEP_ID=MMETSP0168-20121206/7650_1 /TAXON_ID=95228 ORGANISM="Vannella sp., Strain DIVA3 517/6/12" /NCGR_SAMPLE_ID=MMETSP0168 /ASSEMBLY_ACC=CAM_ASM_000044 /LENGTH=264 /DNA_ID=CAMNT_0001829479 /DNA_START=122 /DNA_END=913 /DNA_ORIENTATION=-